MQAAEQPSVHWFPLGETALVVQFGNEISPGIHARVKSFATSLEGNPFPGLLEYVPAFTTVTLYYDPWVVSQKGRCDPYIEVVHSVEKILSEVTEQEETQPRMVEIPVCYGGEFGPDLEWLASHAGMTAQEVIRIHAGGKYLVYMIGFAPGFPYLGGLDKRIATPRKETPRPLIPAGSVGIAGSQTGIYSIETPGGWQLIGRTPLSLFSPNHNRASLLQMGDLVHFVPITPEEYAERKAVGG